MLALNIAEVKNCSHLSHTAKPFSLLKCEEYISMKCA